MGNKPSAQLGHKKHHETDVSRRSSAEKTPRPSVDKANKPLNRFSLDSVAKRLSVDRRTSGEIVNIHGHGQEAHDALAHARQELGKGRHHSFAEAYHIIKGIGSGAFSRVFLCACKDTGVHYAVKVIAKTPDDLRVQRTNVVREIAVMRALHGHANVVELKEVFEEVDCFRLVMEYCGGGELFDQIIAQGHYSEKMAAREARQLLEFIDYMHQHHIIHRDLKPENILLAAKDSDMLKFVDFGTADFCNDGEVLTVKHGSPHYIAPEVLTRSYTKSADIWSAGIILYILLSGKPPFHGKTESQILEKVANGTVSFSSLEWESISAEAKDIVGKMLSRDALARPSPAELLKHPWFEVAEHSEEVALGGDMVRHLQEFAGMSRMKRLALICLARTVQQHEVQQLRELFLSLDHDNDGRVTAEDLHAALSQMGAAPACGELKSMITSAEVAGSSKIPYEEFIAAMLDTALVCRGHRHPVRESFDALDWDHDGVLTAADIMHSLPKRAASMDVAREIIDELDHEHTGRITFDQFAEMMREDGGFCIADSRSTTREPTIRENSLKERDSSLRMSESSNVGGAAVAAAVAAAVGAPGAAPALTLPELTRNSMRRDSIRRDSLRIGEPPNLVRTSLRVGEAPNLARNSLRVGEAPSLVPTSSLRMGEAPSLVPSTSLRLGEDGAGAVRRQRAKAAGPVPGMDWDWDGAPADSPAPGSSASGIGGPKFGAKAPGGVLLGMVGGPDAVGVRDNGASNSLAKGGGAGKVEAVVGATNVLATSRQG